MNKVLYIIAVAVGLLSLIVLYFSGVGYQNGSFDLGQAFTVMRYCAYAGIAGVVLAIAYGAWKRPAGGALVLLIIAGLAGATAFYLPFQQQKLAQSVPPIHDITTNVENPPVFVDVVPLRADAPNPHQYEGAETAAMQLDAYPDLQTMEYSQGRDAVFEVARGVVESMGWDLVSAVESAGRIEATATTRWFGFKDDVVIRIVPGPGGSTLLDMRSKSRVGRSDIGANAARIRAFLVELDNRLGN